MSETLLLPVGVHYEPAASAVMPAPFTEAVPAPPEFLSYDTATEILRGKDGEPGDPGKLVEAWELGFVLDDIYDQAVQDHGRSATVTDATKYANRRLELNELMNANPQPPEVEDADFAAVRREARGIEDVVDAMGLEQKKAFVAVAGDYGKFVPSRVRRILDAVRNAPTRLAVEFINSPKRGKLGALAVAGAAVGILLATRDPHSAQATISAQEMAYTTTTSHVHHAAAAAGSVHGGYRQSADLLQPGDGPNVKPENIPGFPDNVYTPSEAFSDVSNGVASLIPALAVGVPVGAVIAGRIGAHYRHSAHHEEHHAVAHRSHEVEHIYGALVNDPGMEADDYLRIARGTIGGTANVVESAMNYFGTQVHANTEREMGEHLRGLGLVIHNSEIIRTYDFQTGSDRFFYLPQGSNGFSEHALKQFMNRVANAPGSPYGDEDSMFNYLRNDLGLDIDRAQVTAGFDMAGNSDFSYDYRASGRQWVKSKTEKRGPNTEPKYTGNFADTRSARAYDILHKQAINIPRHAAFLGDPVVRADMEALRIDVLGSPGLLANRQTLADRIEAATALIGTPAAIPPAVIAGWRTGIQITEAQMRARINAVLARIPADKTAAELFGLEGLVRIGEIEDPYTHLVTKVILFDNANTVQIALALRSIMH